MRDARALYEAQRTGLGDCLYDELVRTIDRILLNPLVFAEWKPGLRSARCRDFPYRIVYRVKQDVVRVVAVYHLRRDPEQWDAPNR